MTCFRFNVQKIYFGYYLQRIGDPPILFLTHSTNLLNFLKYFYFNDHHNHLTCTSGSACFVSLGVKQAVAIY